MQANKRAREERRRKPRDEREMRDQRSTGHSTRRPAQSVKNLVGHPTEERADAKPAVVSVAPEAVQTTRLQQAIEKHQTCFLCCLLEDHLRSINKMAKSKSRHINSFSTRCLIFIFASSVPNCEGSSKHMLTHECHFGQLAWSHFLAVGEHA